MNRYDSKKIYDISDTFDLIQNTNTIRTHKTTHKSQNLSKKYSISNKDPNLQFSCRICLQDMNFLNITYICKCKGSSAAIHEECFLQWAKRSKPLYRDQKYYSQCQLCKQKIQLDIQKNYRCSTKQQIKRQVLDEQIISTVILIIMLFICLISIGIIIHLITITIFEKNDYIYFIILITISIFMITCVGVFIGKYLIKSQIQYIGFSFKYKQKPNQINKSKNDIQNYSNHIKQSKSIQYQSNNPNIQFQNCNIINLSVHQFI